MSAKKPNVLMIVIDQFRADLLDGRLAEVAGLENLTRLMGECTVFRRHYTVVTPCGPSRVSLLTGQYAMNHRAVRNGTPLRHDTPNLGREMQAAGYEPLLFGYTDTAQDPRVLEADDPRLTSYEELMPGFTEVVRMRQETDDDEWRAYLKAKGYDLPDRWMGLYEPVGGGLRDPALYRAEHSDTAFLTDRFIEHMEGEAQGWFAALTYIRPHPPFVAPAPYNTMYDPTDVPAPARAEDNEEHAYVRAHRVAKPAWDTVQGFPDLEGTPDEVQQIRATYLGLAAEIDHHIGRVIGWLKETGRWDDTILVLTGDHGEMLGDHGGWGKSTFQDAAMHVPLMIRVPGQAPSVIEGMTESVDVAPTILDLVGRAAPASMDGISLRREIETGAGGKDVTFSEHDFGDPVEPSTLQRLLDLTVDQSNFAILRSGRYRLVHFAGPLPQILYDMEGAGEARNIAALPESQAICLDLSRQMLCHRMVNPDGTFARTMVTDGGVKTGPA